MRVILIGKSSGRLDCLAETIVRSKNVQLFILTNYTNPGLHDKGFVTIGPTEDPEFVATYANIIRGSSPSLAIISNEEPLAVGIADVLRRIGIPVVGPSQAAAQIETSKIYARRLLDEYGMQGHNPEWGYFDGKLAGSMADYTTFLNGNGMSFVVKPDGLTGGKGVRVQGEHFFADHEGIQYGDEIIAAGGRVIIEQKLDGEEFSRMCFSDGETVVPMPMVQDHKRLLEGDEGINTGGMGSYSDTDHSLPFLTPQDLKTADELNAKVVELIERNTGHPYVGILYGNFIATADGVKLIEYNARFGDPEVMNVLPLLETDFINLCYAMTRKKLSSQLVQFAHRATVCKYLLPAGYPKPGSRETIDISEIEPNPNLRVYHGALDGQIMTGSRALALVGIGKTIGEAEAIAERAAQQVCGPVYHRHDIGTDALIERRVEHIKRLRSA